MKRHGVRLITAALAAAAAAGCFSDPTSSQQNGPATISVTRTTVYLAASGDSLQVEARITDAAGNLLPMTGATWTTDNAAVADVHIAAVQLPEDASSKAFIVATTNNGGVTTVRVTARGITDSVRVTQVTNTALPTGASSVTGDTVTITAPAGYSFDAAASAVLLGGTTTYLFTRSATTLRVLARAAYTGPAVVTNIFFNGGSSANAVPIAALPTGEDVTVGAATLPAASVTVRTSATFGTNAEILVTPPAGTKFNSGTIVLGAGTASLLTQSADSLVGIMAAAYTGTVKVTGLVVTATNAAVDSLRTTGNSTVNAAVLPAANVVVRTGPLGANTEMKVTPPAGMTFTTASSQVVLGAANGTKLVNTKDSIVVISTNAYTGVVKVTNLSITSTGNALSSLTTAGNSTVNAAPFPGTFTQLGAGGLLDTVLVIGGANADFTTSGASASNVTINSGLAFVLRRAADTLYLLTNASGTSALQISNVIVGGATVSSMSTSGTITISQVSAETDEPTNNAPGAVTFSLTGATQASPYVHYGSVDGDGGGLGTDADDFYAFTLAAVRTVTIQLQFPGTGAGGAVNPDMDLLVCNAACSAYPFGFGGATAGQPENHAIANMPAGTYNIYINGWDTATKTFAYKLIVY